MQIVSYPPRSEWPKLLARPPVDLEAVHGTARRILDRVRREGDAAVRALTKELDGASIESLEVSVAEMSEAASRVPATLRRAIDTAYRNITAFHSAQVPQTAEEAVSCCVETMPGVRCWLRTVPIERVGLYVPGGTAPLFSTVLMLAVPARLAGCREVVLCSPPGPDGSVHPAVLYAARLAGVTRVFRIGGAVAIAAMAHGTESVPRVFKICGPGNRYVMACKQLLATTTGTAVDLPAGPSEVLVMADGGADPEAVAADLLSQAEHGPDSQVLLLTTSATLVPRVQAAVAAQLASLPRGAVASTALQHSRTIVLRDTDEMLAMSEAYAPEHLIVQTADADAIAAAVKHAGSVFLGRYSPESVGDYASGTNHTLPTSGHARAHSGVGVDTFTRRVTFQRLSEAGLRALGPTVEAMALGEGLHAHARAVTVRLRHLQSSL